MKPAQVAILSFISGGIVTRLPFPKNVTLTPFPNFPSLDEPDESLIKNKTVQYIGAACVTYLWFRYGWGIGDIVYATRNQLKTSVQRLSNVVTTNCTILLQRIGIVETQLGNKIDKLHSDHRSLTSLVKGINLKVNNIEVLSLYSSKGISLLCDSLLTAHRELYGDDPKTEVVAKNGVLFGCQHFI
jgi:hypothetical protein